MFKIRLKLLIFILFLSFIPLNGCNIFKSKDADIERISPLSPDSVLFDSQAIKTLTINMINHAAKSVYLQQFAMDDQDVLKALVEKAHQGIDVKILLDPWQRENENTLNYLKNENLSAQRYPSEKGQYDRVKYMVVDNQTAVYYGAPLTSAGFSTHTVAVQLSGTSVSTISNSFSKDWESTTTNKLSIDENPSLIEDQITFSVNAGIKQTLLNRIKAAQSTIWIEVDQLTDTEIKDALIAAQTRGCTVQIIVNPSSAPGGSTSVNEMKNSGIAVRSYKNPANLPLGFNWAIFDQKTVLMSSSGWTYSAFVMCHESSITIPSPDIAAKVSSVFQQDWEKATP
ncbi:hypothetical protein Sgly_2067 [Syntrophobotulus glycolicus DSM 8271]|uniref:Phospholipase D-like domain-containing protein n=1 Tax=Syntrophobotulus glycolicus (strain DSM 8271 / FlGlyR) TaxID=645991 RepID=F0T216_SYNGF|nr:phosphatidylserine/phosphatidylglycerophosphate/cardiolipin synthase family protein [Syntrophobotulus glycolicus]ADY56360.1 hypothetical protein Sgly_2067 [Syntrophobotulus glycolicus DSM 8271]